MIMPDTWKEADETELEAMTKCGKEARFLRKSCVPKTRSALLSTS